MALPAAVFAYREVDVRIKGAAREQVASYMVVQASRLYPRSPRFRRFNDSNGPNVPAYLCVHRFCRRRRLCCGKAASNPGCLLAFLAVSIERSAPGHRKPLHATRGQYMTSPASCGFAPSRLVAPRRLATRRRPGSPKKSRPDQRRPADRLACPGDSLCRRIEGTISADLGPVDRPAALFGGTGGVCRLDRHLQAPQDRPGISQTLRRFWHGTATLTPACG